MSAAAAKPPETRAPDGGGTPPFLDGQEPHFRALVEHSSDFVSVVDPQGVGRYVGPAVERILGYRGEDLVGTNAFEFIHPDDVEPSRVVIETVLADSSAVLTWQYRVRHLDGSWRWMEGVATNRLAEPEIAGIIVNVRDVTDRRLVEEKLRASEEEARQRRLELAHALRVATMGEMASGLAHELNQPLAAIVNYAKGCVRRLGDSVEPEIARALDSIASEALRAGEVVRGLKRFVRREQVRLASVDLAAVVHEAVQLIGAEAAQLGVHIELALAENVPQVVGDSVQLEQVVLNLLRNAMESLAAKGGGRVVVHTSDLDDGRVALEVADEGAGIEPEMLEQIFSPFFTTKQNGLGMGLSISRTIVETHGGRLTASSRPGAGSTFSFTLPISGRAAR